MGFEIPKAFKVKVASTMGLHMRTLASPELFTHKIVRASNVELKIFGNIWERALLLIMERIFVFFVCCNIFCTISSIFVYFNTISYLEITPFPCRYSLSSSKLSKELRQR
jgi:hypothetical protein